MSSFFRRHGKRCSRRSHSTITALHMGWQLPIGRIPRRNCASPDDSQSCRPPTLWATKDQSQTLGKTFPIRPLQHAKANPNWLACCSVQLRSGRIAWAVAALGIIRRSAFDAVSEDRDCHPNMQGKLIVVIVYCIFTVCRK